MALQKQLVPLPMDKGLDTKFDPKQEAAGFLRKAQNIVYETFLKLRKRNGYDQIELDILTTDDDIEGAIRLSKYKSELLCMTSSKLYARSQNREKWIERGTLYPASTITNPIVKNATNLEHCDSIVVDTFQVFTWNDDLGNVRYSVQDTEDKSFIVSDGLVAVGEKPVVSNIQNNVFIIYGDGANLKFKSFSILEPQTLSSATTAAINLDSDNLIDSKSAGSNVVVAYNATTGIGIFKINEDSSLSSIVVVTGEAASDALGVYVDSLFRIVVLYSDGTEVKYVIYPFNLAASILAPTTIQAIADVKTVTSIENGSGVYRAYFEVQQSGISNNYVRQADLTTAGVVTGLADFKRSVGLAANTFEHNDTIYVPVVHESFVQSTYFIYDETGILTTKYANQLASSVILTGVIPEVSFINETTITIASLFRNRLRGENGTFFSTNGVLATELNFNPDSPYSNAELADGLHICAGVLKLYDGNSVTEHGFNVFPETLTQEDISITVTPATTVVGVVGVTSEEQTLTFSFVPGSGSYKLSYSGDETAAIAWNASTATIKAAIEATTYITSTVTVTGSTATGFLIVYDNSMGNVVQPTITTNTLSDPLTGGNMSDGTYAYVAIYKWTDNTGKDHRSAPTILPLTVVLAGGGSTQQVQVSVPTLRLTEKAGAVIELYRTENVGTTYYKVTDDTDPVFNDVTVDTVSIIDTLSDATLIDNEILYTSGGVLENIPAPASMQVTAYNGERLAIIGEQSTRIFWSKITTEGGPVEFTDLIYRDLDPIGGTATAVKAMNDKLVAFQKDACYYVAGEGPNNLGQQDTFTKPEIISTDIGCLDSVSIARIPTGLMFKSRKGIYLLNAGLSLPYIGDRVEGFNSQTVTSADIVAELNQVRFILSEDRALVYNYNLDRWATFENHGGLSSIVIGNDYYYLREDGQVYKENRESFSDATSPIKFRIETGWLSLVELQGFQRAYHAMILADYKSAHKLRVKVAYDFVEAWVQEKLVNPLDFMNPTAYGEDSPYGSGTPYGGSGNLYQARIDFKRQKCQSIKFLIEDAQEEVGEGLSLSAVTVRAGAKQGSNKVAPSQKFGTS